MILFIFILIHFFVLFQISVTLLDQNQGNSWTGMAYYTSKIAEHC